MIAVLSVSGGTWGGFVFFSVGSNVVIAGSDLEVRKDKYKVFGDLRYRF